MSPSLRYFLYSMQCDFIYLIYLILLCPLIIVKIIRNKDFRWLIFAKFSFKKPVLTYPKSHSAKGLPAILISGSSLGEAKLAIKFAQSYSKKKEVSFIFLTATKSGFNFLLNQQHQFSNSTVLVAPFDFSFLVKPFFDDLSIKFAVIVENEYWPNFISQLYSKNVSIFGLNTRLTAKSVRRYKILPSPFRRQFSLLNYYYCSSDIGISCLNHLGVDAKKIIKTPSFKIEIFDFSEADRLEKNKHSIFQGLLINPKFVFVAGSVQPQDLKSVLPAWIKFYKAGSDQLCVIIPRHTAKKVEFLKILQKYLDQPKYLSSNNKDDSLNDDTKNYACFNKNVIFINELGILKSWYQWADCVFVGGSFCKRGGQNFLEPVALKKITATGPYIDNFEAEKNMLLDVNALTIVHNSSELTSFIIKVNSSPDYVNAVTQRAYTTLKNNAYAFDLVVNSILDFSFKK